MTSAHPTSVTKLIAETHTNPIKRCISNLFSTWPSLTYEAPMSISRSKARADVGAGDLTVVGVFRRTPGGRHAGDDMRNRADS